MREQTKRAEVMPDEFFLIAKRHLVAADVRIAGDGVPFFERTSCDRDTPTKGFLMPHNWMQHYCARRFINGEPEGVTDQLGEVIRRHIKSLCGSCGRSAELNQGVCIVCHFANQGAKV
jgi:hypothetical protein